MSYFKPGMLIRKELRYRVGEYLQHGYIGYSIGRICKNNSCLHDQSINLNFKYAAMLILDERMAHNWQLVRTKQFLLFFSDIQSIGYQSVNLKSRLYNQGFCHRIRALQSTYGNAELIVMLYGTTGQNNIVDANEKNFFQSMLETKAKIMLLDSIFQIPSQIEKIVSSIKKSRQKSDFECFLDDLNICSNKSSSYTISSLFGSMSNLTAFCQEFKTKKFHFNTLQKFLLQKGIELEKGCIKDLLSLIILLNSEDT